ncbi:MAG TPA: hypothetical protein VLV45_00055 [Gemmatimonadales bacterium]|nr:hypothetical protein [Gemmatimonadales bacterium]
MAASLAQAEKDRSDFRTVVIGGTKLGLLVSAAVVLYLSVARYAPDGGVRVGLEALLVIAGGTAAAFLPGFWCAARSVEGIAGAAGLGLWGAVVFAVIDIAVLRPLNAYPWTWDDVGGGMTWWYLPMWWMLGTFLAWIGGLVVAGHAKHREPSLVRVAAPVVVGAIVLAVIARLAHLPILLPVAVGAGFALTLVASGLTTLVRRT